MSNVWTKSSCAILAVLALNVVSNAASSAATPDITTAQATPPPAEPPREVISPTAPGPTGQPPHAGPQPTAHQLETWRRAMVRIPKPKKGCFDAAYPNTQWREVPCTTPPHIPYPPRAGQRPETVGNGDDFSNVVTGHMSWAQGSFDSVSGVTSITDGGKANVYSLQLNTEFFKTSACDHAKDKSTCQGWEQFLLQASSGKVWIQYWLINFATTCPAGWNTSGANCWIDSANAASAGAQTSASLGELRLAGTVDSGGVDSAILSVGASFFTATGDSHFPDLPTVWNTAEFNVFGDGDSSEATFNPGSTLVVRTETDSGTKLAPTCSEVGFTGETNNLNLVGTPSVVSESGEPAIVFTESNVAGASGKSCTTTNSLPMIWNFAGNTAGFGQVWDGRPFWVGNFDGQGGKDILFYFPGDKNWWLGRFDTNGVLSWKLAGNTAGFGQVADGRPFWVGNFDGQGGDDILFYFPGDKNWWLGRFDTNGVLSWKLAGNTAGFGQVWDGRPFWVGNFDGQGGKDILFYFPGDHNWWLGRFDANGVLSWKLAGNTAGFGQVADGRPFWVGNFDGQGGDDILFYFPGDKNWWLGRFDASGELNWKLAGNTTGFGQVWDGRPFWVGNFDGQGGDDILFYFPGDKNWWLGRFDTSGALGWKLADNTAGFGQVADGRPFWVGNFDGQGGKDMLFYFPGDQNWWLGRFGGNGAQTWTLVSNTANFGQVGDGRPFWVGNFTGQSADDILFYFPGDKNWWLGRLGPL